MEIRKSLPIKHSLLIDVDGLSRLVKYLHGKFKKVSLIARCNDDTRLEFQSLAELVDYENPTHRRINAIRIVCNKDDVYTSTFGDVEITLGDYLTQWTGIIEYRLEDYQFFLELEKEISARIKQFKPWYSLFTSLDFTTVIFASLIGLFILGTFYGGYLEYIGKFPESTTNDDNSPDMLFWSGFIIVFGASILLGYLLNRINKYLFPEFTFLLGQSNETSSIKFAALRFIFIGVILAIIINVLSSFIYDMVKS
ncbi:hypothetical protein [Neolewinella agarilytica]|nr:hypothetical protein [Neolewinella agarilytica]